MFQQQDYTSHVNAADQIIADTDTLAATMNDENSTPEEIQEAADKLALIGPHMMQLAALHLQAATEIRTRVQTEAQVEMQRLSGFQANEQLQLARQRMMGGK